jgi:hypothetical protein
MTSEARAGPPVGGGWGGTRAASFGCPAGRPHLGLVHHVRSTSGVRGDATSALLGAGVYLEPKAQEPLHLIRDGNSYFH